MVRYDALLAPQWMYSKFEKTPEGYLKGKAVICTTGVYEYQMSDGSIVKELRLPEEVFAQTFLDSLKLKPLTLGHPSVLVNADNIKDFQIGTLGEVIETDGYHLAIDMIIHDAAAIKAVQNGMQALSVGYSCDLEPAEPDARWCGQTYNYVQRSIVANHTSLVDKARAGDAARIRLDSEDAIMVHPSKETDQTDGGGTDMATFKTVTLDGVEYQSEGKVIETLHLAQEKVDAMQATMDEMTTKVTTLEANRDTLKDENETLKVQLDGLKQKKTDEAEIKAAVTRRMRIMDAARLAEVEVTDAMDELAIQTAVIMKVFPKAVLDGRDAVYIDARFDGAVELLANKVEEKADAETRKISAPEHVDNVDSVEVVDSAKARIRMIENLKNRYRGEVK